MTWGVILKPFTFKMLRASKVSSIGQEEARTSIPYYLIELLDLKQPLWKEKILLSYKINAYPNILILTPAELTRDEIIAINEYFGVTENVQHFKDITVYVNKPKTQFLLKFEVPIINFLNMDINGIIGYGILEITLQAKKRQYLIISCDLNIIAKGTDT